MTLHGLLKFHFCLFCKYRIIVWSTAAQKSLNCWTFKSFSFWLLNEIMNWLPCMDNNWPNFPMWNMFDDTTSFTRLLCHCLICMEYVVRILNIQCFMFFLSKCEEMWKACYTAVKTTPTGSPSHLLALEQVVGEVLLSHLTRAHTLKQWIPPTSAAHETTHLLPVDIMLRMKLYS